MKEIKIAHLYYDLMNLYGENGNVKVLKKHLERQGINTKISELTIDDNIDFNKYDIFYIGSGNTEAFNLSLIDILKYKNEIKNAIDNNKFFIVTGNAINLFGKYYLDLNDDEKCCLDVLDFDSKEIDFRIVGEQFFQNSKLKNEIIGFQNRDTVLKNVNEKNLFNVNIGTGYVPKSNFEGIWKKNFYGTYLLGPVLARNPHFTEFLVKNILKEHNLEYKKVHDKFETKAYQEYIKNVKEK